MKKILFGLSVIIATSVSAQNYPDYYPINNNNNNYYGDYDDEYYFPDDYYYEYPSDYYTADFYQSYYNDYRKSIYGVNWNRFFATYRLSHWQIQQIVMLNEMFPTFSAWNSYYRYNPDRWYYDRFFALQQILGPRIYVIYQNNFYNGYNPVVYFRNYRVRHYAPTIYVLPRYRNININVYKIDRNTFHQNNPRTNIGFQQTPRTRNNGFRNDGAVTENNTKNNNIRTENGSTRNNNLRTQPEIRQNNNTPRTTVPERKIENNSQNQRNQTPDNSTRNSGQRFTSR